MPPLQPEDLESPAPGQGRGSIRVRNCDASAAYWSSSKTHLFNNIEGSSSKAHGPLGGAIRKRNWLPGRIAFAYQLRKSDGCNLLKTKLEFASSSKALETFRPFDRQKKKRSPRYMPLRTTTLLIALAPLVSGVLSAQDQSTPSSLGSQEASEIMALKVVDGAVQVFQSRADAIWPGYNLAERPVLLYRPRAWRYYSRAA